MAITVELQVNPDRYGNRGHYPGCTSSSEESCHEPYAKLQQRAAAGQPVRIGLIGAGKFGSMYLAQVPRIPGVQLVGIADLSPDAARRNLERVGWPVERTQAASLDEAIASGATHIGEDWARWCATRRST